MKNKPLRAGPKGLCKSIVLIMLAEMQAQAVLHLAGELTTSATANGSGVLHALNIASKEPEVKKGS